jgi:hypothetical protein
LYNCIIIIYILGNCLPFVKVYYFCPWSRWKKFWLKDNGLSHRTICISSITDYGGVVDIKFNSQYLHVSYLMKLHVCGLLLRRGNLIPMWKPDSSTCILQTFMTLSRKVELNQVLLKLPYDYYSLVIIASNNRKWYRNYINIE